MLGWRDVPTNNKILGRTARSSEPLVRQIFVGRGKVTPKRFELILYLARKRAENRIANDHLAKDQLCYIVSLSSKTIIYKGMFLAHTLDEYFADLSDVRAVSALALVHQRYSTNTFPTWDRAHPYRMVAHNGEINTLRGNVNHMRAREALFALKDFLTQCWTLSR